MIRYNLKKFLFIPGKAFSLFLVIIFIAFSTELKAQDYSIVLGKNNAPVKIKIISSLTCPYCANFHTEVIPEIKKNYVDSGKVQLIFIDFPLDQSAFNASKLLHCCDKTKQMTLLDSIYENQEKWTAGSNISDINNNLKKIAENLGINSNDFNKCLNNDIIADKILNDRIDGQKKYSISSTPTIIINEKKLEDTVNFKNIKKRIEKLI